MRGACVAILLRTMIDTFLLKNLQTIEQFSCEFQNFVCIQLPQKAKNMHMCICVLVGKRVCVCVCAYVCLQDYE